MKKGTKAHRHKGTKFRSGVRSWEIVEILHHSFIRVYWCPFVVEKKAQRHKGT